MTHADDIGARGLFAHGRFVDVEDGRLNIAVREVLATLGVMTADDGTEIDCVVDVARRENGDLSARLTTAGFIAEHSVVPLAETIVAGANIVGRVEVVFAARDGEPVFVAVRQPRQ